MKTGTEVSSISVQDRDMQVLLMSMTLKERTQRPASRHTHHDGCLGRSFAFLSVSSRPEGGSVLSPLGAETASVIYS